MLLMLMNWKMGSNITKEVITWDFFKQSPEMEKVFWGVYDLYDRSHIRRAMTPTDPYAFGVIKELQDRGHEVDVVTRNNPASVKKIEDWMWSHGVDIKVRAMRRPKGTEDSVAAKAKLSYDIFIDDAPVLIEPILKSPSKKLIVYSQPWNDKITIPKGKNVFRAKNWLGVRDILDKLGVL